MSKKFNVIVNVPALQTNTPFTYIADDAVEDDIKIGSRVIVPFGKAERPIQGFVVEEVTQKVTGDLKKIISVLEPEPLLNEELISLSNWLADKTYSYRVSCLNAMIPNLVKVNTRRFVKINSEKITQTQVLELLGEQQVTDLKVSDLTFAQQRQLNHWIKENKVSLEYATENSARKKMINWIWPLITDENYGVEVDKIRKNATKQLELIEILKNIDPDEGISQTTLLNEYHVGRSTLNSAVKNGWAKRSEIERYRDPFEGSDLKSDTSLQLNEEQQQAYDLVVRAIEQHQSKPILIEGVTGSGKTEVYLQSISKAIGEGKSALLLVPEISLTPLMVKRVRARFGRQVAVLHSGLSDGEKFDEWRRIIRNEVKVVVGARSAVFAPLQNLGIIIIDEEHSETYKQTDAPRYHARDVAIYRAKNANCPVVLGSATPSLESRSRVERGRYDFVQIKRRANQKDLPEIKIVDMREHLGDGFNENFSAPMVEEIQKRLLKKEQVVLMLNRRGFSSFVMCRSCGFVLKCPNCDVSLTMHMDTHSMRCHYCGHEEPIPKSCRNCGSTKIRFFGTGTEKVEQQLAEIIPEARVIRMDVDTTRRKGAHERLLAKFGNHDADILLGTQMIAKGLDFPDVTLVGVLNADTALELPDLRASERTFQLLTQVAGRAGRADKKGEVLIQTFNPDHYAIKLAQKQDYEDFFRKEMYLRHLGKYPPYYFTALISISDRDEKEALKSAYEMLNIIQPKVSSNAVILGPTAKSISKIKQKYYYQILIKYQKEPGLHNALLEVLERSQEKFRHGTRISIDPEPQNFL
ncbi:primosomal protein N' [Pediococcus stilesii]|uniref:Replication restart protein PriA n=1 Tax=Pediococcus stilesii TaxID=331679 RepID=A0A0R2L1D9_9LACO|nr:primosomal protein N' [Pediococcus stilesii]KRN95264.1 replication restart DNA helicase PriA [Pediococcus stilesii]